MARKVFWILWVTVWPAVAIIPPLINAQGPHARKSETASDGASARLESTRRQRAVATREVSSISSATEHLPAISRPENLEELPEEPVEQSPTEALPPAPAQPKPSKPAAIDNNDQPVSRPRKTPPGFPSSFPRQSISKSAGSGLATTASTTSGTLSREEHAQQLIHERAAMRAIQRQLRLESKYHGRPIAPAALQATRWQPHLTETNWLAGSREASRP